jgi:hypothetical protein
MILRISPEIGLPFSIKLKTCKQEWLVIEMDDIQTSKVK